VFISNYRIKVSRHRWGAIIALAYLGLAVIGWPTLDGSFSPDTAGYLDLSPYRQPMYGLWANTIYALAGSYETVQVLQCGLFIAVGIWVIFELSLISDIGGPAAAAIFAVGLAALNRFGLITLAGSLISEGLFYVMIMSMVALFLWWLRTRRTGILIALAILLIAMTQLRPAAMLVPILPLAIAVYVLILRPRRQERLGSAIAVIGGLVAGIVFLPPMLGKNFLQFGTARDISGITLLGRISLLPVPRSIAERSPDWATMASSWRKAAASLNIVALTQFDGQLQETIRYELGPRVLLPALLNLSPTGWENRTYPEVLEVRRIGMEWIASEWPIYLRISAYHLWGMLTMASFMDSADRMKVWAALNEVSPLTWGEKPIRRDYPLNQIDKPIKWTTELFYRMIRYACMVTLILGLISMLIVILESIYDRNISPGYLAVALAVGWSIGHSIPGGLLVWPDFRYNSVNLLVLMSGATTWLAYARYPNLVSRSTFPPWAGLKSVRPNGEKV
jgi:hypothetical protein